MKTYRTAGFALVIIILMAFAAYPQWVKTSFPYSGGPGGARYVYALGVNGGNIFTGGIGGIYRSSDTGKNWTAIDTLMSANAFAVNGGYFFAGGYAVYRTADNGASWTWADSASRIGTQIEVFAVKGGYLFAGTDDSGVIRSSDNGTTWNTVNSGIPSGTFVYALAVNGRYLFSGGSKGIYRSADNGSSWTAINHGLASDAYILALVSSGGYVFAGTSDSGIYRTADSGANWTAVNNGLPAASSWGNRAIYTFAVTGGYLFAGGCIDSSSTRFGIYGSGDNGAHWKNTGLNLLSSGRIQDFAVSGGYLFAGGFTSDGLWRRPLSELPVLPDGMRATRLQATVYAKYAHDVITIHYPILSPRAVSISIYSINGKRIAYTKRDMQGRGEYIITIDRGAIPTGIYICKLQEGEYRNCSTFMVGNE